MRILFMHQNLPGQFKHLIKHYALQPGVQIMGLADAERVQANYPSPIEGFDLFGYVFNKKHESTVIRPLRMTDLALRRGYAVAKSLKTLRERGFDPDIIYGHPGWGEMLYVRDVFPNARIVNFCEFYFNRDGQDFGFDAEFPEVDTDGFHVRTENMAQSISLLAADAGVSPTEWQRSRYPAELRQKIQVVHDGIDTRMVRPDPAAKVTLPDKGLTLTASDEVITFVNRNLEPYRGFHVFMRALPELLRRRPKAHVLIVGSDEVSYGRPLKGMCYRERMMKEVGGALDLARVHFLGPLRYQDYLRVLQISCAHVYLTYPFVLSWSLLEAMSAGCVVIGSKTAPVQEVIEDGRNGFLVDFFDCEQWVEKIAWVCDQRANLLPIRQAARATVIERFDLDTVCLPRQVKLLEML
jgi:glycosyltransferase involved in cell wall biosynthesis